MCMWWFGFLFFSSEMVICVHGKISFCQPVCDGWVVLGLGAESILRCTFPVEVLTVLGWMWEAVAFVGPKGIP